MFGLLEPCAHSAARHGIAPSAWQTHLCGLCLGLRDGHGQLARAATNTDAIVLEILTEAQQSEPSAHTGAGPCPLRGMRRAEVVAADAPGVRLAATASLLLGGAKIRDHVDDGDAHRLARRPLTRVSTRWHARARAAAEPLGLDVEPLIAAIESQLRLENSPESTLDELTAPTQLCAAELFAHTAILANRPENADALREAGWHFGRIAHLADALQDLDADNAQGHFNPLSATGTTPEQAHALVAESNSLLRAALARVALDRAATVCWILLDPLGGVVRKLGRAVGIAHTYTTHTCGTHSAAASGASPRGGQPWQPGPGPHYPGLGRPQYPGSEPQFQPPKNRNFGAANPPGAKRRETGPHPLKQRSKVRGQARGSEAEERRREESRLRGREPAPERSGGANRTQPGLVPPGPGGPPMQRPSLLEGLGIIGTQYCTGYACFKWHTGPCSGHRKEPWIDHCDCDCCDCCSNCGGGHHHAAGGGGGCCDGHGCCDCNCGGCDCDCCDGDCCDCDCCGCDCSC
ncbi:DUF5685 family protein [Nocardia sp. NPDC101769]|uniref:DUF5685 family protein n=1 Tax=Nocardia sp. NPDC101769 TaxID=3364333 RepID=UPI003811E735